MTNRVENYTLSCPCKGIVIEGDLVKVHGESAAPKVGTYLGCPCGCLHRVRDVDHAVHLVVVERLTHDQQIEVYRDMGIDMVRVGCPHCDDVTITRVPDEFGEADLDRLVLSCFECHQPFVTDGRDGHDLRTRALTDVEHAVLRRQLAAQSRARAFGSWGSGAGAAKGSTPFGTDPFDPFGPGRGSS
jgi:hypothetical protein